MTITERSRKIYFPKHNRWPLQTVNEARGEAAAAQESEKSKRFLTLRNFVSAQLNADTHTINQIKGSANPPRTTFIIGDDKSIFKRMAPHQGKVYPSLQRDFRNNLLPLPAPRNEFFIDFEAGKLNNFSELHQFRSKFEVLGVPFDDHLKSLMDLKQYEDSIWRLNPIPKELNYLSQTNKAFFRMAVKGKINQERLKHQYFQNDYNDDYGIFMRTQFILKHLIEGGPKSMDHYLVYTFPLSDQERDIYSSVYWDAPEPEHGFSGTTPEHRWIVDYNAGKIVVPTRDDRLVDLMGSLNLHRSRQDGPSRNNHSVDLMGSMKIQNSAPPAYAQSNNPFWKAMGGFNLQVQQPEL